MHNKSFFQGLGLGLVIASVVFLILYSTRAKDNVSTDNKIAEIQTETELTTSILDLPDKSEDVHVVKEKEVVSEVGTIKDNTSKADINNVDFEIEKIESPEVPEIQKPEIETIKKPEAIRENKNDAVTVKINVGDNASDIYHKLYKAGVIDDEDKFANFVTEYGYSRMMLPGEFKIPKDATYKEIYDIIKAN